MLAFGHKRHHFLICAGSIVADFTPRHVRGCFPGLAQSSWPQEQPLSAGSKIGKIGHWRART
jgi:hypothetical protein